MQFNIFVDTICSLTEPLLSHLGLNVGYEIDGHLASCRNPQHHRQCWVTSYADDIVILTDSQEKMQAALEILDQFFSGWGVEINIQKTEWMRPGELSSQEPLCEVLINGCQVHEVEAFKFSRSSAAITYL
jgi:hypothetical protein